MKRLLLALIATLASACGREVTAPKVTGCVKVDTLWRRDDGATLVMTTYSHEPCSKGKP